MVQIVRLCKNKYIFWTPIIRTFYKLVFFWKVNVTTKIDPGQNEGTFVRVFLTSAIENSKWSASHPYAFSTFMETEISCRVQKSYQLSPPFCWFSANHIPISHFFTTHLTFIALCTVSCSAICKYAAETFTLLLEWFKSHTRIILQSLKLQMQKIP